MKSLYLNGIYSERRENRVDKKCVQSFSATLLETNSLILVFRSPYSRIRLHPIFQIMKSSPFAFELATRFGYYYCWYGRRLYRV